MSLAIQVSTLTPRPKIIIPMHMDEMSEQCNSFVLVSKPNGRARMSLDAARLNQALIRPVYSEPTTNNIIPK